MTMDPRKAIIELRKSLRDRTLVPFCGAGISRNSTPPIPTATAIMADAGLADLKWSQATTVLSKNPGFRVKFKEIFGDPPESQRKPSRQQMLLASLDARFYITTNYDELLERALQLSRRDGVGVLNQLKDMPGAMSHRNLVIKLHGDIHSEELLVFSGADYMHRWQAPTPVDGLVNLLFSTHNILFVGYSLNDEHIASILEKESLVAPIARRRKYLLAYNLNENQRRYLEAIDVIAIELASFAPTVEEAVCAFLYRLWEQHDYFETRTQMIDGEPKTQIERLHRAILHQQAGHTHLAKELLEKIYKDGLFEIKEVSYLPSFQWLNISVHDKLNDWQGLLATERQILSIFASLERGNPAEVIQMIRMAYFSTLSLAYLKHGHLNEAADRIQMAISQPCTDTAHPSLQIIYANALTTRALVSLYFWAENNEPIDVLLNTVPQLDAAWNLFCEHGKVGLADESHHIGRYFGTRAYVESHLLLKGVGRADISEIKDLSRRAHTPAARRPISGQVAGKYCEAYINFVAIKMGFGDRISEAEKTKQLCSEISPQTSRNGFVDVKVNLLLAYVTALIAGGDPSQSNIDRIFASADFSVAEQARRTGYSTWIGLPLN